MNRVTAASYCWGESNPVAGRAAKRLGSRFAGRSPCDGLPVSTASRYHANQKTQTPSNEKSDLEVTKDAAADSQAPHVLWRDSGQLQAA